jgi:hypothetical protein
LNTKKSGVSSTTVNKTSVRDKRISGRKTGTTTVRRKVKAGSKGVVVASQVQSQPQPLHQKKKINTLADLATTPEAKANVNMLDAFLAESAKNSPYIKAVEFKGAGKRLEILSAEIDRTPFNITTNNNRNGQQQQRQRTGPRMVFTCKDLDDKDNRERIWTAGQMAVLAIKPLYDKGERVMRVWSRGVDQNTKYYADKTDLSKTKEEEAAEYDEKNHDIGSNATLNNDSSVVTTTVNDEAASATVDGAEKIKEYKKGYAKVGKTKVKKKQKKKSRRGKQTKK